MNSSTKRVMMPTRESIGLLRRCLGVIAMLLAVVFVLLMLRSESTTARWSAAEQSQSSFEAATVPAPELTRDCEYRPGLLGLGARVRIFWRPPAGYELSDIEVQASTAGLGSVLAPITGFSLSGSTISVADGYQTDVPTNLLGGLLGLGSELEIAFWVEDGSWASASTSIASNAGLIVGLGASCRNLN